MQTDSESRILRERIEDALDAIDRPDVQSAVDGWVVAQVYNAGAIPTTVPAFFACHPVEVGGTETEGTTGTVTPGTDSMQVLVLGPAVPSAGTILIAFLTGGRWTAGLGGGGSASGAGQTDSVGISARSGTTAGHGVFYIVSINTSSFALSTSATPIGGIPIYNISSGAVAANKYIQWKRDAAGAYWVDVESCA